MESDADQFAIQSAGLTITKTQTVIDDPFSAASPRAIPGATVEYLIEIENTSATTPADDVSISDPVPANTTFLTAQRRRYHGRRSSGRAPAMPRCGHRRLRHHGPGALAVDSTVIGDVAGGATVTVAFRVTIN